AVAHSEFEWLAVMSAKISVHDPVERLRALHLLVVDYARKKPALFRLLLLFPPEYRREYFEVANPPTSLGGRVLRAEAEAVCDAIDQGRFRGDDPFLIGMTLYTTLQGIATLLAMEPNLRPGF